ncbi:MAG TPA: hypothetical protein VGG74_13650 [Kofleriaceae bacterium]
MREATVAWSRRTRGEGGDEPDEPEAKPEPKSEPKSEKSDTRAETKSDDTTPLPMKPGDAKKPDAKPETKDAKDAKPSEAKIPDSGPTVIARAQTETVAMPIVAQSRPPDMPHSVAPPPLVLGDVESPTHMPGPKDIPSGEPSDRAPAPGVVPRGDSRSFRRNHEFALVYRVGTYVISRFGTVGQRGQWRVVEYPTSSSASHSYAKECSRFVSEGFSDYRE